MASRVPPRAASRYKQLRLQFTEEAGGRISVSLYVKPLNTEWSEHHCLQRWSRTVDGPLETLEDAISLLIALLEEDLLPGIG
jgi:hypothetical protein